MEKEFPRNVRQIGNVSDTPKIYIEDYVDTFFNQLCDKADQEPIGAFLIGETRKQEDTDCIFISGAVQMKEIQIKGTDLILSEETWKAAYTESKEFFDGSEILGWFLTFPGRPMSLNSNLVKMHEKSFAKQNGIFIMKDPVDKEELYFTYKFRELMQMGGHYIYYEKNPQMQNYMITSRKKIGVTPSEVVEDRVTKDFRDIVKDKIEYHEQKQSTRFMYAASTFLILVVLVIGITTINNYDKMQSVQSTLENFTKGAENEDGPAEVQETSGKVTEDPATKESDSKSEDVVQKDIAKENEPTAPNPDVPNAGSQLTDEDYYIVQKGDTLATISKKVYGTTKQVDAICRMNGLSDGNLIFIGQKLLLP